MKFISWNVNGLRACVQKGFLDFFTSIDADFFCIQAVSYTHLSEKTGASTATISRVNRSLKYVNDGYEMVFSRMAEKETKGD